MYSSLDKLVPHQRNCPLYGIIFYLGGPLLEVVLYKYKDKILNLLLYIAIISTEDTITTSVQSTSPTVSLQVNIPSFPLV